MISLHISQLAIWILLYILHYTSSVEYDTIWANINNEQPRGILALTPERACHWTHYNNNPNEFIGSRQRPYINYGTRYGKVNKTNFENCETINNKHTAEPIHHDDHDQIENIKYEPLNSSNVVFLVGYDDEIYNIMYNIIMAGHTGPVDVHFYLYHAHKYFNIGRARTFSRVLELVLSKYNHFNCINLNYIIIPPINDIFNADEYFKNCNNLVGEINEIVNNMKDSVGENFNYYSHNGINRQANCKHNIFNKNKPSDDINQNNNDLTITNSLWLPHNHLKNLENTNNDYRGPYKFVDSIKANVQDKITHLNYEIDNEVSAMNNNVKNLYAKLANNEVVNKFAKNINTNWPERYSTNKPGETNIFLSAKGYDIYNTHDLHPDLYYKCFPDQQDMVTVDPVELCRLDSNEIDLNLKNLETISNYVDIETENTKPTTNGLDDAENLKNNNSKHTLPINANVHRSISYSKIKNPKQMYTEKSVNNRNCSDYFYTEYAKDQEGQIAVPYELTNSYETDDIALGDNEKDDRILPCQNHRKEDLLLPKIKLNLPLNAELQSSIPKTLAYSLIKSNMNIQKIFPTGLTNANFDHLVSIKPSLFSGHAKTFDSNPMLKYLTKSNKYSNAYNLIQTDENNATNNEKSSAIPNEPKSFISSSETNQYIPSEKGNIAYILTGPETAPTQKLPGFNSQKVLPNLKTVPSHHQAPSFNAYEYSLPESISMTKLDCFHKRLPIANEKPVQATNENTNPFDIPSVTYTQFISGYPNNELLIEVIPPKTFPSRSLKPCYETDAKTPVNLKKSSPMSYLSAFPNLQQYNFNKPSKLSMYPSFNIPYDLALIQPDQTRKLDLNIKDKINLKQSQRDEDNSYYIPTSFGAERNDFSPYKCNSNRKNVIQETPYVDSAQLPQISNKKNIIMPYANYYNLKHMNNNNYGIRYQTTPKEKNILSNIEHNGSSKMPSLNNNIEPLMIFPRSSKTYNTNIVIPKLPLNTNETSKPENINLNPFSHICRMHQTLPISTQKYYQPNVPSQNEEENKFQEKEPIPNKRGIINNMPFFKGIISNGSNENTAKYSSGTQRKPSYLKSLNRPYDTIPNLIFSDIYNVSTAPNYTSQSQYSLISEPQNESNIDQTSKGIAIPLNFPLITQILQIYKPKSSEILKQTHHEPAPYSNTLLPEIISPQHRKQNAKDLNFSLRRYGNPPLYNILPTIEPAKVYTGGMHKSFPNYIQPNLEKEKYSMYKTFGKPSHFDDMISTSPIKTLQGQCFPNLKPQNKNSGGKLVTDKTTKPGNNQLLQNYEPELVSKPLNQERVLRTSAPELPLPQSKVTDYISKPEINKAQSKPNETTKSFASKILQTYQSKFPNQSYQEPISLPILAQELIPPHSKQQDLKVSKSPLARSTSNEDPHVYEPYDDGNIAPNVQPVKVSAATNHESNLNFNQAMSNKEICSKNLYRQPNWLGLPNLTHKGPSSTPYIHKHSPFQYSTPMWKILPRTLSNDSSRPKPQIQFTAFSEPTKNTFKQRMPYKNIVEYVDTENYKIPKQKIHKKSAILQGKVIPTQYKTQPQFSLHNDNIKLSTFNEPQSITTELHPVQVHDRYYIPTQYLTPQTVTQNPIKYTCDNKHVNKVEDKILTELTHSPIIMEAKNRSEDSGKHKLWFRQYFNPYLVKGSPIFNYSPNFESSSPGLKYANALLSERKPSLYKSSLYTSENFLNSNPQIKIPSTNVKPIEVSFNQTSILNSTLWPKLWSNMYENSVNTIKVEGREDRNANSRLAGSVSPYPFMLSTSQARDFSYTPTPLIYPYKQLSSIFQYTKQKPISQETLFSPTITTPTLRPVDPKANKLKRLLQPKQNFVKLFGPLYPTFRYPNNIKLTNKDNIPTYCTSSTDNNEKYSNYLQPTNIVSKAPISSVSISHNQVTSTPTKSLLNDNILKSVRILNNGQLQTVRVPRPTEITSNPFATGIYTPSTLRVSPNMSQDYLAAKTYKPGNIIPSFLQSSGNLNRIPVLINKLIKNKPKQGQHSQKTKNVIGLEKTPLKPCENCNCKVAKNPTIMDQIIKHLYNYSETLPDCKIYEHTFTNNKITLPLSEMGLSKYVVTEPNEYFMGTEIPGLFIKAWGSKIKIIKPKLVFDVEEYQGYNFMPVVKNHYYTPEFAQNLAKDIVTRLYGKPIVINGVYSAASPYAIIDDINNSSEKDGKAYILWPTLCNCGCMSSGCKCCFSVDSKVTNTEQVFAQ